jgi:ElaB/YqjD/DUF883 family membrane-anchored ribosome-binding protein
MKASEIAEGAVAVGGIALEAGGFVLDIAKDKVKDFASNPSEKSSEMAAKGKEFVKSNPAIVAGVGAAVGILLLSSLIFRK